MKKSIILLINTILLIIIIVINIVINNQEVNIIIEDEKVEDEKVIIRFCSNWGGVDKKSEILKNILEEFEEENSDIKIIDESIGGSDFLYKLAAYFAAGMDMDVFGLWPGSDRNMLIDKGKVADLSLILKADSEWYSSFDKDVWEYAKRDGKIYSLPFEIIYEGLFINLDLFEKYNVKIPYTYDDLLLAIDKFNKVGIIPIAYNSTLEGSFIYQNIIMKLGGKLDTENPYDENGVIKPPFIEAMNKMKQLYNRGAFPQKSFTIDDDTRNNLFIQKKAAMIVQGTWFIGNNFEEEELKNIKIIPFPYFSEQVETKNNIIYGIGNGNFHMSQSAWEDNRKREASLKLLKALTSKKSAETFSQASGFLSSVTFREHKNIYIEKQLKNLIHSGTQLVGPVDHYIDRRGWEHIITEQFPMMLGGEMKPDELVDGFSRN